MCNMKMKQKKAASAQKVNKLKTAKEALEQKYKMELEKSDREIKTENVQQLLLKRTISDVCRDTEKTSKIDSI